jgi:hypothetical protein
MTRLTITLIALLSTVTAFAQSSPVIWNGQYGKFLPSLGLKLSDDKEMRTISVDPSAGAGVAASVGSIALRNNAGSGEGWFKVGAANTAWTNFLTASSGWSLSGNAGTNAAANYLGTSDAVDFVIRTNATERLRVTSAGLIDTTLATGAAYFDATGVLSTEAQLAMSRGGTNKNMTASAGAMAYSDADSLELTAVGSAGQVMMSNGSSAPAFSDIPMADTVWVDKAGNDATCAVGAPNRPCLTVAQANSLIGTPTSATRKRVKIGIGTFIEATMVIKPWTTYAGADGVQQGGNSRISVTAPNITLDPSWSAGSQRVTLANLYFTGSTGMNLDFQGIAAAGSHTIELNNVGMNGAITYNSNTGTLGFLDLVNVRLFGALTASGGSISIYNTVLLGNVTMNNTGAQNLETDVYNTAFMSNMTFAQSGGNTLIARVTGGRLTGTLTASGTAALTYDVVALPTLESNISLSGGATLAKRSQAYALGYSPSVPGNWSGPPTDVYDALEELSSAFGAGGVNFLYLPGRAGGQIATGGTAASNNLTLRSTSNGTKGQVYLDETTASTSPTTGALRVDGGAGIGGQLSAGGALRSDTSLVLSDPGAGTNTTTIQAGTVSASYSVTLPTAQGTGALYNDGAGVTTWQTLTPQLFGTFQTGRSIVAGTGITSGAGHMSTTAPSQLIFVVGASGGTDITANPQIQAGTTVGQVMKICGTSDSDWVQLDTGTGLITNGPAILGKGDCIVMNWLGSDGSVSVWGEESRNF